MLSAETLTFPVRTGLCNFTLANPRQFLLVNGDVSDCKGLKTTSLVRNEVPEIVSHAVKVPW